MYCPTFFCALQLVLFGSATCSSGAYDYVIVGGGAAGLIIANRLSASPNITVAVIEAGDSTLHDAKVAKIPSSLADYGFWINTTLDWGYKTVPQKHTANRSIDYAAGRGIGGSTAINGMTYVRAEKAQIDAWENLGNVGLNWDSLLEYYVEQEDFQPPDAQQSVKGATYEPEVHGSRGGLNIGFNPFLTGQGAFQAINETSRALGYAFNQDVNDGHMPGTTVWPMTINVNEGTREDAGRAWYYPIADRPNLHIYLNTTALRLVWDDSEYSTVDAKASGIEVITNTNTTKTIHAAKEVILAAGAIRSPALLEHSGVGNEAVLKPLGIKTMVNQPSLGSNLQDQPAGGIVYTSSTNWTGYPTFVTFLTASDLFGNELASVASELKANISAYARNIVAEYASGSVTVEVQQQLLEHQFDLVFGRNSTVPLLELLWAPFGNAIIAQFWNLLPFSRGSIHIGSADPQTPPNIDPNFLQLPIDTYVLAAGAVRIRELFSTAPLSSYVGAEASPSFNVVPQNATWRDPAWKAWIDQSYNGNSHPLSTCAMMRKDLGGVVDGEGKVYGTQNVRVVDASVFPTQISGHLSATVYALAGKIASAILKQNA